MAYIEKGDRKSSWSARTTAVQRRPYVAPLKYTARGGSWGMVQDKTAIDLRNSCPLVKNQIHAEPSVIESSNKALNKLYGELNQAESLLVAWKERQKAIDLVTSNVRRLITIARAVKRKDPKIVRAVLRRNPKAKDIVKQPAGLWLEYHFGIVPTVMDIHHGLGVLGYDFPVQKLSCSSMATNTYTMRPKGYSKWWQDHDYKTVTKLGGEIYALNPNVQLASMLGFGQPLSVAWEMTPFSWFVDYFVNVGELVKNLEPRFPGVRVRNKYSTTLIKSSGVVGSLVSKEELRLNTYNSFYMKRETSWPSFKLEFKSPLDLKGQQCSYVVAVLTQLLTGMKKK